MKVRKGMEGHWQWVTAQIPPKTRKKPWDEWETEQQSQCCSYSRQKRIKHTCMCRRAFQEGGKRRRKKVWLWEIQTLKIDISDSARQLFQFNSSVLYFIRCCLIYIVLKRLCRGLGKCSVYLVWANALPEAFSPEKQGEEKDYFHSSPNDLDGFWETFCIVGTGREIMVFSRKVSCLKREAVLNQVSGVPGKRLSWKAKNKSPVRQTGVLLELKYADFQCNMEKKR